MTHLSLALVGCGRIAQLVHLPVLTRLRGVRVAALAEPDPALREAAGRAAPGAALFADHDALLAAGGVDAVVVCAPTALHASVAVAAFAAGLHVYLEKPIATAADDAALVVDAWRRAGTVGMAGFNFRFHPGFAALRALVRDGALGEPVAVRTVFTSAARELPAWKRRRASGGGVLLDLASHHVDLARFLLDDEAAEVSARTRSLRTEADTAAVELRMRGGAMVQSFVSNAAGVDDHRVEVVGDRAAARVDRATGRVEACRPGGGRAERLARALRALDPRPHLRAGREPSFALALGAFAEAARAGRPAARVRPDLEDGRRSLAVVTAAETAARSGRPVRLGGSDAAGARRGIGA
jgi:predicted dehydrogenase